MMAGVDGLSALEGRPTAVLIADKLRERIIDGSFELGEQITEAALSEKLNVSRGPIREALQRLTQEGLLVGRRNRGVFVIDISPADISEIYAARQAVETAAAAEVLHGGEARIDQTVRKLKSIVAKLPAAVSARDWNKVAQLDLKFHEAFVAGSGNSRLSRIFVTLSAESRLCMVHVKISYPRFEAIVPEHQNMIELLDSRNSVGLHAAIVKHMEQATTDLTASMEATLAERKDAEINSKESA